MRTIIGWRVTPRIRVTRTHGIIGETLPRFGTSRTYSGGDRNPRRVGGGFGIFGVWVEFTYLKAVWS